MAPSHLQVLIILVEKTVYIFSNIFVEVISLELWCQIFYRYQTNFINGYLCFHRFPIYELALLSVCNCRVKRKFISASMCHYKRGQQGRCGGWLVISGELCIEKSTRFLTHVHSSTYSQIPTYDRECHLSIFWPLSGVVMESSAH